MGKLCKLLAICCILFISGCTNKETSETAKSASQETITSVSYTHLTLPTNSLV